MDSSPYIMDLTPEQLALVKSAGIPTFDEYAKNPDKYRRQNVLESIERGPSNLRNFTGKDYFYVNGWRVNSLEHAERVISELGWKVSECTYRVNLDNAGGKFDNHIYIERKAALNTGAGNGEETNQGRQ